MEVVTKKRLHLMSGRANLPLAEEIADRLGVKLVDANLAEFANGELHCRFGESVRGTDVFIIQSHSNSEAMSVNDALMEQLIMVDAAKRASAKRITVVCPYYGYGRQDRKAEGRAPITAKLVANLFTVAGAAQDYIAHYALWMHHVLDEHTFHEILVLFSHLAALTTRMHFITSVLVLPQRQTALVAKQIASIDLLSGGRIRVAVGVGWNAAEYEGLGVDFADRTALLEEQIDVMRMLWTQPLVDFDGRFYQARDCELIPRGPRPDGPPPQMSCSRSTIRAPGAISVSRYAVHRPV